MKHLAWILACLLAGCISSSPTTQTTQRGALVLVGGGSTPIEAVHEAISLAGGAESRVVIIAWASNREERGVGSVEMYREAGANNVLNFDEVDSAEMQSTIASADLIWIPGGQQGRLMERLREHNLIATIREAHEQGCVVGGTSAGAAVASESMIAGPPSDSGIRAGISRLEPGLGLWPGVIVDQHFTERNRQSRLLSAVLDNASQLGVGISERTAVVVTASSIRVLGESTVLIYDARDAILEQGLGDGTNAGARGVRLHVLRAGSPAGSLDL